MPCVRHRKVLSKYIMAIIICFLYVFIGAVKLRNNSGYQIEQYDSLCSPVKRLFCFKEFLLANTACLVA